MALAVYTTLPEKIALLRLNWLGDETLQVVDNILDADFVYVERTTPLLESLFYGEGNPKAAKGILQDQMIEYMEEAEVIMRAVLFNKPIIAVSTSALFAAYLYGYRILHGCERHKQTHTAFSYDSNELLDVPSAHQQVIFPNGLNVDELDILMWSYPLTNNYYYFSSGDDKRNVVGKEKVMAELEVFRIDGMKLLGIMGCPYHEGRGYTKYRDFLCGVAWNHVLDNVINYDTEESKRIKSKYKTISITS